MITFIMNMITFIMIMITFIMNNLECMLFAL